MWPLVERRLLAGLGVLALAGLGLRLWQLQRPLLSLEEAAAPAPAAQWEAALSHARQVDVNTADVAELERLPGVGPALAGRIVADRAQHGPFASVQDLARVAGIGPKTLAALAAYLTVDSSDGAPPRQRVR